MSQSYTDKTESRRVARIWESICPFIAPKVLKIKSFCIINAALWHYSACSSQGDYWIILSWDLKTFWFQAPRLQRCPEARRYSDPVKALRMLQCVPAWSAAHLLHVLIFPEFSLGCFLHFIGLNLRTPGFSEESENRDCLFFPLYFEYTTIHIQAICKELTLLRDLGNLIAIVFTKSKTQLL